MNKALNIGDIVVVKNCGDVYMYPDLMAKKYGQKELMELLSKHKVGKEISIEVGTEGEVIGKFNIITPENNKLIYENFIVLQITKPVISEYYKKWYPPESDMILKVGEVICIVSSYYLEIVKSKE